MSHAELENTLRQIREAGTRVDSAQERDAPQVWRFAHDRKFYRLHFYPRRFGRNPALRELRSFQQLQKAGVRSPRAISAMVGFRLGDQQGDALLIELIEPAVTLEQLLIDCELKAAPVPRRAELLRQLIEILQQLARAGLGHDRLELANFIVRDGELFLNDARGVRRGGLTMKQLLRLAGNAARFATRGDYLRAARELGGSNVSPIRTRSWERSRRAMTRRIFGDNAHFAAFTSDGWSGVFTQRTSHPLRWASASQVQFDRASWECAWPKLLKRFRSGALATIKDDDGGAVMRAQITLNGDAFDVIVKAPKRKFWRQWLAEIFRGSRARRTWFHTWRSLVRGVPTELPMLLMERRVFGYAVESILVFQQVPGQTLASADLDALDERARENLFRRAGRSLRQLEDQGFTHADAKSTNWIVFPDPVHGPRPILIDLYGVRHYRWAMLGIERLLRAMRDHPQYTPDDSRNLCLGYAPRAKLARQELAK
ncbi:hypothetical protein BH09PLA1_BH09PLA1_14950 [soil metagenome]